MTLGARRARHRMRPENWRFALAAREDISEHCQDGEHCEIASQSDHLFANELLIQMRRR